MKKLFRMIALSAIAATFVLPVLAQPTTAQPQSSTTATAGQGEEEAKAALYKQFLDTYKTDQPTAYKVAREYLQKYPQETDQTKYLKRWIDGYEAREKSARKGEVGKLIEAKKFNEAFALGKEILAAEPEDLGTLYSLAMGGLVATTSGNKAFNMDASNYARKAIQLLEGGKGNLSASDKDKTLGQLYSTLGVLNFDSAPSEAANSFFKAVQYENLKKDPQTYALLAGAIQKSEYDPLQKDFNSRFTTPEAKASPEAKAATDKVNAVVDRMIDALARAVALATDPRFAQAKTDWMQNLTQFYKYRHEGSDAGLNELIAGVLSKPMPQPGQASSTGATAPTPAATTPAATTTTTATGSNVSTSGGATTTNTTTATETPKATTPANTGAPKSTTPKTTTPTTTKPTPPK